MVYCICNKLSTYVDLRPIQCVFFLKLIYYTDSRYKVYKDKLQNCSCNRFHCIGTSNQVETNNMTNNRGGNKAVKNE